MKLTSEIHQKESTCKANVEHSQDPAIQKLRKHTILVPYLDGYSNKESVRSTLLYSTLLYYTVLYFLSEGLYIRGG